MRSRNEGVWRGKEEREKMKREEEREGKKRDKEYEQRRSGRKKIREDTMCIRSENELAGMTASDDDYEAVCPKCGVLFSAADNGVWVCCDECKNWYDFKCTCIKRYRKQSLKNIYVVSKIDFGKRSLSTCVQLIIFYSCLMIRTESHNPIILLFFVYAPYLLCEK